MSLGEEQHFALIGSCQSPLRQHTADVTILQLSILGHPSMSLTSTTRHGCDTLCYLVLDHLHSCFRIATHINVSRAFK